jgi:hypothetical protein
MVLQTSRKQDSTRKSLSMLSQCTPLSTTTNWSCIRWQLVPVPDGLGEERISEGLTARSFLIKAIFLIVIIVVFYTAQSFRGTLCIHVWIRFLNWKKKKKNNNQSKSLNLNSYNVRYIYIVYILYSKANNNIYFHKSKDKRNPEKKVWSILLLWLLLLLFFHSCCYTIIMSNHVKTFYAENI